MKRNMLWRVLLMSAVLLLSAVSVQAQDDDESADATLVIDGSALVEPIVNELVAAYQDSVETEFAPTLETNGPNVAFEAFCNGELDVVMTTRYINFDEESICGANEVDFVELILGYDVVVVVVSDSIFDSTQCLTTGQLDDVYGLVADGLDVTTEDLGILVADGEDATPVTVYAPEAGSAAYNLMSDVVDSGELRSDLTNYQTPGELAELLTGDSATLAMLTLSEYDALENKDDLNRIDIQNPNTGICASSNIGSVQTGDYIGHQPLSLYLSGNVLRDVELGQFITFINNSPDGLLGVLPANERTAPTQVSLARNMNNLLQPFLGRTYSRETAPVSISSAAAGEVVIAGDALTLPIVNTLLGSFSQQYANAVVERALIGSGAGFAALCAGEADVVFTTTVPTEEEVAACETEDAELYELTIGAEAVVFAVSVVNEALPTCLTLDNLVTVFAASDQDGATDIEAEEDREIPTGVANWSDVDSGFPDQDLFLFTPGRSAYETDWLFTVAGADVTFARSNLEANVTYDRSFGDPAAYRAASVANYEGGGLGVLRWQDYSASERQDGLRLLEVDAGEGCVAPSPETFDDGSYVLANTTRAYFTSQSAGDEVVGALMWSLVGENSVVALEDLNLPSDNADGLREERDAVFVFIETAVEEAAQAALDAAEEESETESEDTATEEDNESESDAGDAEEESDTSDE